jgi:anti-sigma regulatory factor (Ser/Thr protein kinase)
VSENLSSPAAAEALLAAEPESVGRARALLTRLLEEAGVGDEARRAALLVASELVTNAITHGSRTGDKISVAYTIHNDLLLLQIRDAARGPAVPVALTADEERPGGRGLSIVERLAEWSERVVDGRREVRAELRL